MRYVLTFLRLCLLRAVACKRIVVVGGTHGNEYTGVYLVKALLATPAPVSYTHLTLPTTPYV